MKKIIRRLTPVAFLFMLVCMLSMSASIPAKARTKPCRHQFQRSYYWQCVDGTKSCKYRHKKVCVDKCRKCKYTRRYDAHNNKGYRIYQPCTFKTVTVWRNSYGYWEIHKKCKGCGRYEIFYSKKRP